MHHLKEQFQRLSTLLYGLICAAGCFYQIKSVTDTYFNYAITTQVKVELPSKLFLPALNVCFRINDVFDFTQFESNTTRLSRGSDSRLNTTERILASVTIAHLFRFTPPNSLVASCIYRRPESYDFHQVDGPACMDFFNVTNFYLMEYLCYRIRMVKYDSQEYRYRSAAFALARTGLFYSVSFNISTFQKVQYMKIILNELDSRPFRSSAFTSPIARFYNPMTRAARYNHFALTYYIVNNKLLEAPYVTDCIDYTKFGLLDAEECIKQCLVNKSMSSFDRYPYSVLEQKKLPNKIFTLPILKGNNSVSSMLYRYERKCQSQCKKVGCKLSYTITQATKDPNNDYLSFDVNIPQLPNYIIKFRPKMDFIEYFIYVLSCFGTWFGLSILSLNPFRAKLWTVHESSTKRRKSVQSDHYMKKQADRYHRTCIYCSQTRYILLNTAKQRLDSIAKLNRSL